MADMQLNMRVSEEVAERFRAFCKEQGVSQPQGMDSLLSMMEVVQAKQSVPNRQTEIESFEMHIKAVMDAFVNSLAINAEAEERVKMQFVSSLESKEKTIITLQKKVESLQAMLDEVQVTEKESKNRVEDAEKAAIAAQRSAEDKAAIIDVLTAKLNEVESKLGGYDSIKKNEQAAQEQVQQLQLQLKEVEYAKKAAIMEIEHKATQEKMELQEQVAREREQLERNHNMEIKALYEKMSIYQDQIATLTKEKK